MDVQWNEAGAEEAAKLANYVKFTELGQAVIGKYIEQHEEPGFGGVGKDTVFVFQGKDDRFTINPNPDLRKRLSVAKIGDICRVTYVSDKDVGKPSPMKVFKLEIAKLPTGAAVPATPVKNIDLPF